MSVAIGEREAANALRIQRGENLRNAATAVVADEVHLVDVQGIEKFLEHLRIGRHGYILIRRDFGVAVCKQVHGYAPPDIGQVRQLMTPQMAVQQNAMYEQRDRSRALFRVADAARSGLHATLNRW